MNVSNVIPFLAVVLLISCQTDIFQELENVQPSEPQYNKVDERLWLYFERFENEADTRGLSIDLNTHNTTGEIEQITDDGVAGTCQYGTHINHVTVDIKFWNNSSELLREFVVFHELGHCVLERDHEESSFDNGICRSIMRSGLEECYDAYNAQNRTYYLDELFSTVGNLSDSESVIL